MMRVHTYKAIAAALFTALSGAAHADLTGDELNAFIGNDPEQGLGNFFAGDVTTPPVGAIPVVAGPGEELSNTFQPGYTVSLDLEAPNIVRIRQSAAVPVQFGTDLRFALNDFDTPILGVNILSSYAQDSEPINVEVINNGADLVVLIPQQALSVGDNDIVLQLFFEGDIGGNSDRLLDDQVTSNLFLTGTNLWDFLGEPDTTATVSDAITEFNSSAGIGGLFQADITGDTIVFDYFGDIAQLQNQLTLEIKDIDAFVTNAILPLNEFGPTQLYFTPDSIELIIDPQTFQAGRSRAIIELEFGESPATERDTLLGDSIRSLLTLNNVANLWLGGAVQGPIGRVVDATTTEYLYDDGVGNIFSADLERNIMTFSVTANNGGALFAPTTLEFTEIDGPIQAAEIISNTFDSGSLTTDANGFTLNIDPQTLSPGVTYTAIVRLLFSPQLVITTQPVNDIANPGSSIAFFVEAAGSDQSAGQPVSYQWLRNGTPLVNNGRISGADTELLRIASPTPDDIDFYSVEVSIPFAGQTITLTSDPVVGAVYPVASDPADLDSNGTVNVFDLIAFLQAFSAALNP